jgi:tRNA uridine 5-carboxymethylaminomethyl modification enzyme
MMTARAEYRLAIRADNSTTRLGHLALNAECVSPARRRQIESHLSRHGSSEFMETPEGRADALYQPYVERQRREWEAVRRDASVRLPQDLSYSQIPGISTEMCERLSAARPETLDQAARISGITPAALSALYVAAVRKAA